MTKEKGGKGWMQLLTKEELKETGGFLEEYPKVEDMLKESEECTDEDIMAILEKTAQREPSLVDSIDRCYQAFERDPSHSPLALPSPLQPSTTMSGIEYPWGAQLEESVTRLKELPLHYKELVKA